MAGDDSGTQYRDARAALRDALDAGETPRERYRGVLAVGARHLGVENGHLKEIRDGPDGDVDVAVSTDDEWIPEGAHLDDAGFCTMVLDHGDVLGIHDTVVCGYEDNPGYAEHGVQCYLAAPVRVDGDTFGTLCFVDDAPRDHEFSERERLFVDFVAELVGRDIEQRGVANTLTERSQYDALVRAATSAVFLVDTDTRTVVEASETAADLTGRDQAELVGLDYTTFFPEIGELEQAESLPWFLDHDGSRERLPDGSEIAFERPDGTRIPVAVSTERVESGGEQFLQVVAEDIRERRERERRAEAIFDQTHQFTGLLSPDGTLLEANGTAVSITSKTREELVGKPFWECEWWQVGPEVRARLRDAVARAADGEFVRYEEEVQTGSGETLTIDFSIRPVTDGDGDVRLLIPEGRDITERVERERQLDVLSRVLRHNFRNHLTVIRGGIASLPASLDDRDATKVELALESLDDLESLIRQYRRTVEVLRSPPDAEHIDVGVWAQSCVERVREAYPAVSVTLETDEDCTLSVVPAVTEALGELVENAAEHNDGATQRVEVAVEGGGDAVRVRISDDGPGLPDSEAAILSGEQSVDPLSHGTGIGLWRAYWILDLVDATLSVDTGADGTTIEVAIPTTGASGTPAARPTAE